MKLKPFQEATVNKILGALASPNGSGRYLVADEVGLGKTRVAQHVIDRLCKPDKHLEVFYVCSSLSIIHQNREALLDIVPLSIRDHARVSVDRLTLLPANRITKKASFTLFTLTPGTLPGGNRTGRADERAVMWRLLCDAIPGLQRQKTVEACFQRNVKSWEYHLAMAERNRDAALCREFRRRLANELKLAGAPWASTFINKIKHEISEDRGRDLIAKCRLSLGQAALDRLSPDLIIFDEFQRFFELLVPGEDDDPIARQIVEHLLSSKRSAAPAILLLSATPYRPFTAWSEGAHGHYEKFFALLEFLFGKTAKLNVEALKSDLKEYRDRLQTDAPGSGDVFAVRDRIATRLNRVMTRTERPREKMGATSEFDIIPAPIEPMDIRLFKHLSNSVARPQDRSSVPGYWSSIPFPLQMMDTGYVLAEKALFVPLTGAARRACLSWRKVRRYEAIAQPHPKLRALLRSTPAEFLALPWMPPTLSWWPLGGTFERARESVRGNNSKVLLFSRFRAVPRAIASILSYEAERYCFSPEQQRSRGIKPVAYEYRTEKGNRPLAGLRKRPSASFTFPNISKQDTAMRTLLMFFPMPELARLGDPLALGVSPASLSLEQAIKLIEERIIARLGVSSGNRSRDPIWTWATALERYGTQWDRLKIAFETWADGGSPSDTEQDPNEMNGLGQAIQQFLGGDQPRTPPSARDVRTLAELALLAPGNLLYRAINRFFGKRTIQSEMVSRVNAITTASVRGLRPYLDLADFHLLFRARHHHQHPAAVRQAIWDGNLEATLDEYIATLSGLGNPTLDAEGEGRVIKSIGESLTVGAAGVSVHETGNVDAGEVFRMRCHAALPFSLGHQEKESGTGELRSDNLRISFNSPFRPHALATTSIGQEGLDFHVWSNRVVHWDLPSNPIDLEQRDGRVDRYAGLAIRRALATRAGTLPSGDQSPWRRLAEAQVEEAGGLSPWWTCIGATVHRIALVPPFSKMDEDMQLLRDSLSLYRLALGQADQEALIHALHCRVAESGRDPEKFWRWLEAARIDLSPRQFPVAPAGRGLTAVG